MPRLFIAIIIIIATILAINTYIFYTQPRTHIIRQTILFGDEKPGYASLKLSASYDIKVVRDGKIIATRHKENDPISIQWYRLVADMMFGFIRDGAVTWLDTSGTVRSWVDTEYVDWDGTTQIMFNPKAYIALGSGIGTPSVNDYKLFNEVTKDVASMNVQDDATNSQYILTYTRSFTVTSGFTLTEVGLLLYMDVSGSGHTYVYLLVAHDSVSPGIDLVNGDTVTVTYTITIPYSVNGPFTRWFYNALINYWLGYKGTTGSALTLKAESSNTGGIDTMVDYDTYYFDSPDGEKDGVDGEYVYIEIGGGSPAVNPLFETYNLSDRLQRVRIDNAQFLNEINETGSFTIHYVVSFSFTNSASVSEIGISYYTDTNPGYYKSTSLKPDYYLWLYWSLANPISVNPGDGLRVEITIEIPYT